MSIIIVGGARPNFMKIAPIIRAFQQADYKQLHLVHTGQHYDQAMSGVFFEELGIPKPDFYLDVGSASHAVQTARIMIEFEKVCLQTKPHTVVVVGDVNSTLACALVAKKLHIRVAHIEAGLRSGDRAMPEEINRLATDAISDQLFITEPSGLENLKNEGHPDDKLFYCGNVMIDTLFHQLEKLPQQPSEHAPQGPFGVVTLHRPSNVDSPDHLRGILESLITISLDLPLVFPIHPRTQSRIKEFGLQELLASGDITTHKPLPYQAFLSLWKDAKAVFTDSGGIQEETTALGVPCFTLRENTERPVTITEGTNVLAGVHKDGILKAWRHHLEHGPKKDQRPKFWDGHAATRIRDILLRFMA